MEQKNTDETVELADKNLESVSGGTRMIICELNANNVDTTDEEENDQMMMCHKCGNPRLFCICGVK